MADLVLARYDECAPSHPAGERPQFSDSARPEDNPTRSGEFKPHYQPSVFGEHVLILHANARHRHHLRHCIAPDRIVGSFLVTNGGIGIAINLHQHEARGFRRLAKDVEAGNSCFLHAVPGILQSGRDEGVFESGLHLNINVNDIHIALMIAYAIGAEGYRRSC